MSFMYALAETPPLARGRLFPVSLDSYDVGNTPACAGKTRKVAGVNRRREKHPRLRGEDADIGGLLDIGKETPPLARGRHGEYAASASCGRNTPACAGKTHGSLKSKKPRRKHPRLRGEDPCAPCGRALGEETPPLARGRPLLECGVPRGVGNTPACAGKTSPTEPPRPSSRETPPLARGRLSEIGVSGADGGNTPACAGKTCVCTPIRAAYSETPPLARGRLRERETSFVVKRNTPACAGKTVIRTGKERVQWKHPRLRGEDRHRINGHRTRTETPPLARGRQQHFVQRQASQYKIRCY